MTRRLALDFAEEYGMEVYNEVVERAGTHGTEFGNPVPTEESLRLVYGLLEIVDFQCVQYGDFTSLTEEELKSFLQRHKDEVLGCGSEVIPSYWGLVSGAFSFLQGVKP